VDDFEGYWIRDPLVKPAPKLVIFYLHGGGFTMGNPRTRKANGRKHGLLFGISHEHYQIYPRASSTYIQS
jgi:acetyl esterase/lipase